MGNSAEELIANTIQEIGEELGMGYVKTRLYTYDVQGDPLDMSVELCYPPISKETGKYINTNFIWANLADGKLTIGRECFDTNSGTGIDKDDMEILLGCPDMFDQIEEHFKQYKREIEAERVQKQG